MTAGKIPNFTWMVWKGTVTRESQTSRRLDDVTFISRGLSSIAMRKARLLGLWVRQLAPYSSKSAISSPCTLSADTCDAVAFLAPGNPKAKILRFRHHLPRACTHSSTFARVLLYWTWSNWFHGTFESFFPSTFSSFRRWLGFLLENDPSAINPSQ